MLVPPCFQLFQLRCDIGRRAANQKPAHLVTATQLSPFRFLSIPIRIVLMYTIGRDTNTANSIMSCQFYRDKCYSPSHLNGPVPIRTRKSDADLRKFCAALCVGFSVSMPQNGKCICRNR
ncbi:hypothetical protein CRM22_006270 [Opisthorchis felineus]|uniref:Uncharacterized protein n=1 Tax=Opisthorchis felineus TaxID=147828 RepID=A0A4V6RGY5_OPIFE|nr:hypothetical protein CRM22_006270 [Opisthorchis felineus]